MPRDLVAIRQILRKLPEIEQVIPKELQDLKFAARGFDLCEQQLDLLENALPEDPHETLGKPGIIKEGFSDELDRILESSSHARKWIANLENIEKARTGIKTLKRAKLF